LDLREIRRQYDDRLEMHNALRFEFDHGNVEAYVHLAIGLHGPIANYSAAEHGLGLIEKSVKHWTNGVEAIVVQKGAFKDSRS
jgi:hypothetical protein